MSKYFCITDFAIKVLFGVFAMKRVVKLLVNSFSNLLEGKTCFDR
jgi:hypothetical protein